MAHSFYYLGKASSQARRQEHDRERPQGGKDHAAGRNDRDVVERRSELPGTASSRHLPAGGVFGPDMSRIRWMKLLSRFGLAERSSPGKWQLLGPIKGLFSKSEGIQLGDAGLARIADLAWAHPGGLFIFDSYTKLTSKLQIQQRLHQLLMASKKRLLQSGV